MLTRRHFCVTAAVTTAAAGLRAQTSSRLNVADAERPRVLATAEAALLLAPRPLTAILPPRPNSDPHAFISDPDLLANATATPFRAHADALVAASAQVAALTAAFYLSQDARFALHAGKHLYAWLVDPATRMAPSMPALTAPESVTDLAPLAEIARALPFLADSAALSPPDRAEALAWFREFADWLANARPAQIAREAKDHSGAAHLLLSAAAARLLHDTGTLTLLTNRFKRPTLRNQIAMNGDFPHEVATPYPWRNTLLTFDLLGCACELLSTPFLSLWTAELDDGPGLRVAAAFLYPLLRSPERWPFLADATHFREVPLRRPALLLAGRAYDRPDYVELWRTLTAAPAPFGPGSSQPFPASLPIREPLLWTARPPHGG